MGTFILFLRILLYGNKQKQQTKEYKMNQLNIIASHIEGVHCVEFSILLENDNFKKFLKFVLKNGLTNKTLDKIDSYIYQHQDLI